MKRILLILLVLGLIGGYVYADQRGWLANNNPVNSTEINTLQGNIGQQFSILSSRAQQLGSLAQNVFDTSVKVDDSDQSVQQKAIDYGQYLYCKQVVSSYETKNPE